MQHYLDIFLFFPLFFFLQKRKGLTIVYKDVNTYDPSAWYVPFLFTLMALFLAALLAWACHLIWKYGNIKALCQKARNKVNKKR